MNFIDRTIGIFSPKAAYNRARWREAFRSFYDSGSSDRPNTGWTTINQNAEQTDKVQRDVIRARARDLERNSDMAESIIGSFERNIIGTGMTLQAKVKKKDGSEDEVLNNEIEELWNEWCRARNVDITGQQCFKEMQRMAVRRMQVDGGIIFVKVYTADGLLPFKLQIREVDDLDNLKNSYGYGKKRIVGGIELDEHNKPIAYYLKKYTPDGFYFGESEKIPANRVIFLWDKKRPSQVREISPMARTVQRVKDVDEFTEAISVKERILACLSVFITKVNPSGSLGRNVKVDKKSGYPTRTIAPGMIQELEPGEKVEVVNPSGQASNAKEFITTQQRLAGSGQGISYEAASRDMSQVNYSSARQGLLEDQKTYTIMQDFIKDHLCYEVYTEFVISAVLAGKLSIPDFWQNKHNYLKHSWITSGWSWIDPLKEVKANIEAIDNSMDTLANVCGARGMDWKDVMKQRAKEKEYSKQLGIDDGGEAGGKIGKANNGNATEKNS